MSSYKSHYACFNCRKTFKRRLLSDILHGDNKESKETPSKCPECSQLMANMGLDFESPKKKDVKSWEHLSTLYEVGITFHSCGCSGPGYIPRDADELIGFFSKIKADYIEHQTSWARRKDDPENQSEIAKDSNDNWVYLSKIPTKMKTGTRNKPKFDAREAQKYWGGKIKEVQTKMDTITKRSKK